MQTAVFSVAFQQDRAAWLELPANSQMCMLISKLQLLLEGPRILIHDQRTQKKMQNSSSTLENGLIVASRAVMTQMFLQVPTFVFSEV